MEIMIKEQKPFCIYSSNYRLNEDNDHPLGDDIYSSYENKIIDDKSIFFVGFISNLSEIKNEYEIHSGEIEEIVIKLYNKVGRNIPFYLEGSYAIVIVDHQNLIMFRDRFSAENLYYINKDDDSFIISNKISEIKKFIKLEVNKEILPKYFILSQIETGETFFKDINTPKRCEALVFNKNTREWTSFVYDDLYLPFENKYDNDQDVQSKIENIIRNNCERVCNSYQNCDIINSLSGGVDSSYIQVVLKDLGHNKAYTVHYPPPYGESVHQYSSDIGNLLNTDHRMVEVEVSEIVQIMEEGIRNCEVPYMYEGENLLYGMYKKMSENNNDLKQIMLFDGNGADTTFGFGRGLMEIKYLSMFGILELAKLFSNIVLKHSSQNTLWRYNTLIKGLESNHIDGEFLFAFFNNKEAADIVKKAFNLEDVSHIYDYELKEIAKYDVPLIEKLYRLKLFEYELIRENNITFQNAKKWGIIAIFPYLNQELLKFMVNVPVDKKIKRFVMKYHIKKIAGQYIPDEYIYRKKIGDCDKNKSYLQLSFQSEDGFKSIIEEIKGSNYDQYFNFDYDMIFKNAEHESIALKLITFHIWHKLFIEQ